MSTSSIEREQLVDILVRTGRGDQQAFSELYKHTSAKLYSVCLRMLHDRGTAEEVLQEIYITVWNKADRFDPKLASPITWLVALSRNKAIDRLRRHREETFSDPSRLERVVDDQAAPIADAEASQEYKRLEDCLGTLEPRNRNAVCEAFFSGATYSQLAERWSVPLGTMKSWIRRSLLQLRACLER